MSDSQVGKHQLLCDFLVYLHNAKDLQDGQNVSVEAGISYQQNGADTDCPWRLFNLTTRTTLLVRLRRFNKIAIMNWTPCSEWQTPSPYPQFRILESVWAKEHLLGGFCLSRISNNGVENPSSDCHPPPTSYTLP